MNKLRIIMFNMYQLGRIYSVLIIYLALFAPAIAIAQGNTSNIKGKIHEDGIPVEYAHIGLFQYDNDSNPAALAISDSEGNYSLSVEQEGEFVLKVSFIGYESYQQYITLTSGENLDLDVELTPDSELLESIEITGEKVNVTYLLDKKIVTFNKEMIAGTTSAADVLRKVPEVNLDAKGNLKIRGKSGITILVDGKPTMLSPADLLKNIPSNTISSVEIITSPSAKYDPDGSAGVINIITQQQQDMSVSGRATIGLGLVEKYDGSLKLDVSKGKWSHFLMAGMRHEDNPATEKRRFFRNGVFEYETIAEEDEISEFQIAQAGTEFQINSANSVYLSLQYSNLDKNTPISLEINDTELTAPSTGSGLVDFGIREQKIQTGYLHSGEKSSIGADIVYSNGKARVNSESNTSIEGAEAYTSGQKNEIDFYFFDYNVDYSTSLGENLKLELGYAGEEVRFDNQYQANFNGGQSELFYTYKESIQAGFSLVTFKKDKLTLQGGLRFENILQEISTLPNDPYQNLYPSFGLEYNINDARSLSFNYSRRISRPDPFQFSPFERQANSREIIAGNPKLNPAYTNNVEISYNWFTEKMGLRATAYYALTSDLISKVLLQEDDLSRITYANIDKSHNFGIGLSAETDISSWYSLDASTDLIGYRLKDNKFQELNYDGVYTIVKLNQVFSIAEGFNLQVNGVYTSGYFEPLRKLRSVYQVGATVEKSLFNQRADLSFSVNRFIYTGERSTRFSGPYEVVEEYVPQNPVFRASFTYRFSKK
ncbi:TonB-dependent receptor domain-containing protein [Roseivirga sp. BDSF3-8]|uniref:TonB-dependent receptor domain-containing protein n=1 Tax=Roseivirga sp. BDSF3-8 TaxID=3241598 RepID=UPI003531E54D